MRRYRWFKHHAWAGLALLTIFLSLRYLIQIPNIVFLPVLLILIVYILISLIGTYLYSKEILEESLPEEKIDFDKKLEKERLKLEKKKAKLEYKLRKKQKR